MGVRPVLCLCAAVGILIKYGEYLVYTAAVA